MHCLASWRIRLHACWSGDCYAGIRPSNKTLRQQTGAMMNKEDAAGGIDVRMEGVGKHVGPLQVLQDVNLNVAAGQLVSVVGRSGSGKSTLLRLLAGLDTASVGRIRADAKALAQARHDIRIMYQDARL